MKLWLDDIRQPPNETWLWAKDIETAKLMVIFSAEDGPDSFEACSLDHDLGLGDKADAIYFVDWMAEYNIWPQEKPVIHSMNPVGRARMQRTIDRYFNCEA
jgi:hypothetical protein